MNEPIPNRLKEKFSCVFDSGTLEHILTFPQAIKNAMEMVSFVGHFLGIGRANNSSDHGLYQFSPSSSTALFPKITAIWLRQ